MSKVSTYFPSYQMRMNTDKLTHKDGYLYVRHQGTYFICKIPRLGVTETQKRALWHFMWVGGEVRPVVSISHEKPTEPDLPKEFFSPPKEPFRHYRPYAMTIVTVQLMGEETPRKIKIYFCDVEFHENYQHAKHKGVYIVDL